MQRHLPRSLSPAVRAARWYARHSDRVLPLSRRATAGRHRHPYEGAASQDGCHPDGLRDLLAEIAGMGFARNLRAFNLSTYEGRRAQGAALDRAIPSFLDVVRPLLASPRLQFVDIFYMWRPTYLTDDNILALSQAWTQLERLDIVIRNRPHLSPTLNCLSHLARHCPKLVKVLLFAEIVIQEPLCVPELPPSSPHPLRELRFTERPGGWDVDAVPPASIARFLYTLFPNLVLEECNPFDAPDFNGQGARMANGTASVLRTAAGSVGIHTA
ncbi:hypothetical protein C8Q76DRAFT_753830 [Earliella scabrosa]|nr:hypothetical protein C8Q76DRAFT_753830 [Earliella scabrosa]